MNQIFSQNQKLGSFEIVRVREAEEIGGILYEMKSSICGARLMFLHTSEENKLFSVTFKTIPFDDTGVFHILEHSVLGGSEKYPVREPFVEMMKSSMNTFLNAMTFPDKTMYPVSSRNEKDFINLTSVYLDAVFKPAIYTNPNIFYQEGWHYEVDPESNEVTVNGVVYNEMKGAESSVDERMVNAIHKMLFPDTCYHYNSGGASTDIPKLTYEQFIDTHKKFYSPDNAVFYIEGDLDINAVIPLIDGYLYHEESFNPEITFIKRQEKTIPQATIVEYPVDEGEDLKQKTHYSFTKIWSDSIDYVKVYGAKVINSYLNSSNSAPLMKKILEKNLANDVSINVQPALAQTYLCMDFYGSEEGKEDEIKATWKEVYEEIKENGFDRDELEAILCRLEFIALEESEPKAIGHAVSAVSNLLYGDDPLEGLSRNPLLKALREGLDTDFYMNILDAIFDESNMSYVMAKPSTTIASKEEEAERKLVKELTKDWTSVDFENAKNREETLKIWQQTPDSEENLDTIPKLKLSDVSKTPPKRITNVFELDGVRVLTHPAQISELTYLRFYFPIDKKYQKLIGEVNFLTNLFTELPTANYDVMGLNRLLKKNFGSFNTSFSCSFKKWHKDDAFAFLVLSISVMKSNISKVAEVISEVLENTDFNNKNLIFNILEQTFDGCREDIISEGNYIARDRALAPSSVHATIVERIDGYDYYKMLKGYKSDFENKVESFISFANEFMKDTFTRDGLVVSFTVSEADSVSPDFMEEYKVHEILSSIPEGLSEGRNEADNRNNSKYLFDDKMAPFKKTFIRIPGKVGFASTAVNADGIGYNLDGRWNVVKNIVRLEYLWNRVRVQGGAYGVNMGASNTNMLTFTSYRDPSAVKTFDVYNQSGKALKEIVDNGINLEKYIISAINDLEPLVAPKHYGSLCDRIYLDEVTDEERTKNYNLRLNMKVDDLISIAASMDELFLNEENLSMCLVGNNSEGFDPDVTLEL